MDFSNVKALLFDVDGVFTDSTLHITEEGDLLRTMNTRDGYIVKHSINVGLHLGIITGGKSTGVALRLDKLGIQDIFIGITNKKETLMEFSNHYKYQLSDLLYVGDDYPDWEVLQMVGYPCCPADAEPAVLDICTYVSPFKGGSGCVRDIISKVLLAKNLPLH